MAPVRAAALLAAAAAGSLGKEVRYEWDVREWVVDFLRPTVNTSALCVGRGAGCGGIGSATARELPFAIPRDRQKVALLANGQYPGPTIEAEENDTIVVVLHNRLPAQSTMVHWHGVWNTDTPWEDGVYGVTGGAVPPGGTYEYRMRAYPPGTHYWHGHMDALQQARGLRGGIIIHPKVERHRRAQYEDRVLMLSDEWRDPIACFHRDGGQPGSPVCSDAEYASFNGQYGDGSAELPWPLMEVDAGRCYRLRIIGSANSAENFIFSMAGHNMTLVAADGGDVEPTMVRSLNVISGGRYDVLFCADQPDGHYLLTADYNQACGLKKDKHFPIPGIDGALACKWYAFLRYRGTATPLPAAVRPQAPHFEVPTGTGGGSDPQLPAGVGVDATLRRDLPKLRPIATAGEDDWPTEPDARIVLSMGTLSPAEPTAESPMGQTGRLYLDLDTRRRSWSRPSSPLLHTKAGCGVDATPVINISESVRHVEVVVNNLAPQAHMLHLHGQRFRVVGMADFEWCTVNKTACFLTPYQLNKCPKEDRSGGDADGSPSLKIPDFGASRPDAHLPWIKAPLYWGCKYNAAKDAASLIPVNSAPLLDSVSVWQRSWTVLRIKFDKPGVWLFHCHLEPHIPIGMMTAFNVLPSRQPPIPSHAAALGYGSCPIENRA